jgi:hypothetical protein
LVEENNIASNENITVWVVGTYISVCCRCDTNDACKMFGGCGHPMSLIIHVLQFLLFFELSVSCYTYKRKLWIDFESDKTEIYHSWKLYNSNLSLFMVWNITPLIRKLFPYNTKTTVTHFYITRVWSLNDANTKVNLWYTVYKYYAYKTILEEYITNPAKSYGQKLEKTSGCAIWGNWPDVTR